MPAFQNTLESRHYLFLSPQNYMDYEYSRCCLVICMRFGNDRLPVETESFA